ncbi:hypothetical protein [Pseudoduganella chitinolytica]|uniref:Uncharacterized protein n=1 Tax=Pseudoduganella chitinolytica TaxID=34070 RepID=A0ABY8BHJ2_9BURK|nr:hypothetical protein [Pseudoduganella chitinolytica]WEF35397.1 hypothetical protein PX653_11775 [Pseudoduganella chitinolytica]
MAKKVKSTVWQAGVDAFAARRKKVEALRAAVRSAREGTARPGARLVASNDGMDEQVRHAALAATLPLRQELEALKDEVAGLRRQVAELSKRDG